MTAPQANNPLHGLTLQTILTALVDKYGWPTLSKKIEIRCFYNDPSIKSSLKFLRKTPWAREKVEQLYIHNFAGKNAPKKQRAPSAKNENPENFVWPTINK